MLIVSSVDHGPPIFNTLRHVVLDEADRMLEMGFGEDVGKSWRSTSFHSIQFSFTPTSHNVIFLFRPDD